VGVADGRRRSERLWGEPVSDLPWWWDDFTVAPAFGATLLEVGPAGGVWRLIPGKGLRYVWAGWLS